MKKSGLADSPFFAAPPPEGTPAFLPGPLPAGMPTEEGQALTEQTSAVSPNRRATTSRTRDTVASRYHDTAGPRVYDVAIAVVRKAVKEFGKEAATHRFTVQEKKAIADLIYTYKNHGIKTSENEIARIAMNFLIEEYKQHGEGSVLHKILTALNE